MKMQNCGHDDCFTCPYKDCIIKETDIRLDEIDNYEIKIPRKCGRKPLDPEERRRRRNEYSKRYYEQHKEACKKRMREYARKRNGVAV